MYNNKYETGLIIKSVNNNNVTITGYATVFNSVDTHGDMILKGAFKNIAVNNNPQTNIKLLWQHDINTPIGLVTNILEDDYGLQVEANINQHIQKGLEAVALIKQKVINNFSIGFTIEDASYNNFGHREIKSALLWEVSIVTFPANQHAQIHNLKYYYNENIQLTDLFNSLAQAKQSLKKII